MKAQSRPKPGIKRSRPGPSARRGVRRSGKLSVSSPEVSVILPTFNERENILPLVGGILTHTPPGTEVIVIDDDSPDRTWEAVARESRRRPGLRLLHRKSDRGLTSALREGIALAKGRIIVWMDTDLSMPPEIVPRLLQAVRDGSDLAVGSRYMPGGGVEIVKGTSDTLLAYLMSLLLNKFAGLVLGSWFKDYTSGFIAVRREVLDSLPLQGDYGEYFIGLIYKAGRKGYRLTEVPYVCRARRKGASKTYVCLGDYLKKGWKYIHLIIHLRLARIS